MTNEWSAEREEFLADVITTAVEGGIGYWSQCSQYQWVDTREGNAVRVSVGKRAGDGARATVHVLNGNESGYLEEGVEITTTTVARGIELILAKDSTLVNDRLKGYVREADRHSDAGMIDSDAADVIVQAGLFGEVVYG